MVQVWYCVSPKDRPKFEAMAKSMFPELHSVCPAFLRHKDILFSPKLLRTYGVEYVQVCTPTRPAGLDQGLQGLAAHNGVS